MAEFRDIHDHMCEFLVAVTHSKAGSYSAVQEWDIQSALRYYLPPPLSGIDLIPYSALKSTYSKLGELVLHQGGQTSTGFQDFSESLDKFTKRENKVIPQPMTVGFVYRLELMELPASFFNLCSNLCRFEQGIAFCFMEGFLRRALEKATILHYQLRQARSNTASLIRFQALMPIHPNFPWEERKVDFSSCLRLIQKTANNTQQRYGASNDLILNELYDVVGMCCDLIAMKIKRNEEILLLAYELLAALARDAFRIYKIFEQYDLFAIVRQEMLALGMIMPQRGAEALLDIVYFSILGLTSEYIVRMIPKLREPLIKVARIYSALDDKVRRTNWTLTKSAMLYKASIDPSYIVEDAVGAEIEEFVRTGTLSNNRDSGKDATLNQRNAETVANGSDDSYSTAGGSIVSSSTMKTDNRSLSLNDLVWENVAIPTKKKVHELSDAELLADEKINIDNTEVKPGTYGYCGVSNCGSLRFPDHPCEHGTFSKISDDHAFDMSLKLPLVVQNGMAESIMPVSKLSAREKGLIQMLEYRKGKEGLGPLQKIAVTPSPSFKKSKTEKLRKDVSDAALLDKSVKKDLFKDFSDTRATPTKQIVSISLAEIPDLIMTRPPPK